MTTHTTVACHQTSIDMSLTIIRAGVFCAAHGSERFTVSPGSDAALYFGHVTGGMVKVWWHGVAWIAHPGMFRELQ
jgi:hypothetical protein